MASAETICVLAWRMVEIASGGGMGGVELAVAARRERAGLEVLFVTGLARASMDRCGRLGPGTEVMSKPLAVDALSDAVQRTIDAERHGGSARRPYPNDRSSFSIRGANPRRAMLS